MLRSWLFWISCFCFLLTFGQIQGANASQVVTEFSEQVVPFDRISRQMWRFLPERMADFSRVYSFRALPDGSAILVRKTGNEVYRLSLVAKVNTDRTARVSGLSFFDTTGREVFGLKVKERGRDLSPFPKGRMLKGELPFFPADGVAWTEITATVMGALDLSVRMARDIAAGTLDAWISVGSAPFFRYHERVSGFARQIAYDILMPWEAINVEMIEIGRIEARKTQTDDMFIGTEEFWWNGRSVGMGEFQAALEGSVIRFADATRSSYDSFLRFYALKQ